jgi:serine/threonine protein kinase
VVLDPPDEDKEATQKVKRPPKRAAPLPGSYAALRQGIVPGEPFGDYQIVRFLAQGGMGHVYVARDAEGQEVALKVLLNRPEQDLDLEAKRRFDREGLILEGLRHPNVVRLLGRGVDARTGLAYLALELVDGRNLSSLVASTPRQRLSVPEATFVLERCARGLAAAHEAGVIHRDIKASNVLVSRRGEVKVSDFGIALSKHASSRITAHNMLMGTLACLAPEVLETKDWSLAADMYALGCLAHRILAGRPPFAGRSLKELVIARRDPPPSLPDMIPEVPVMLGKLVDALLARDPSDRPSAREFLVALEGLGLGEDTHGLTLRWEQGRIGAGSFQEESPDELAFSQADTQRRQRPAPRHSPSDSDTQALRFGPYLALTRLEDDVFDEAYLCQHSETEVRHAVRLLPEGLLPDAGARDAFRQGIEALVAAGPPAHPALRALHAAGSTAENRPWYALDHVSGRSLARALPDLTVAQGLDVVTTVAEAMAAAHAMGQVHRALDPHEVLLGHDGRVHVSGLGVARLVTVNEQSLTLSGEVYGSPAYLAPEQVDSGSGEVGPWTDVYALGALLYRVLAGRPVYTGDSLEVCRALVDGQHVPTPSEANPTARVAPALEALSLRALSRDPGQRPATAGDFLSQLQRARDGEPEPAPASMAWIAVVLAVVALLGIAGLLGWFLGG